ncbi:glycosyltransferase family 4 protein [Mongoliitalea lutea]|uniref:Uncharacterized protein n=1 Tax=Mongoliitalea lutea TaxID=849756 RepID=A0A8J3CUL0_9BACT|nr:glycosyltransferase family 1 protein [Mongoliitalea lutea]GHB31376.1 hypothetical protein GCM10008106_10130 [Mongoliitalea lutea]
MKVIHHFNREVRPGNVTFEQLFGALRKEIANYYPINNFDLPIGLNKWQAIQWAKKNSGLLNHITGDVNFLAYGLPKGNTILTVHDLGHYQQTLTHLKKIVYGEFWLKGPFKRVRMLTSISEFTKNQMVNAFNISPEKIKVIHNPLLPGFFPVARTQNNVPVILQIGSGANKNLASLIHAVKGLDVKLLLVNHLRNDHERMLLEKFKINYTQLTNLNFDQLVQAYAACDILYFASSYEGFGLPILEAQAVGRAVITSRSSSMPEVAGDAAVYVDHFSIEEIRDAIVRISSSTDFQEKLIQNGFENIKRFNLSVIAKQYAELYEQLF